MKNENIEVTKQMKKDSVFLRETYSNKKVVDSAVKKASIIDFVSKDENRYFMTGVYYENGFAVATNGRVLIKLKTNYPSEYEGKIINPSNGKEIDGQFPNYKKVFPKKEYLVDRSDRLAHITDYLSSATMAVALSSKNYDIPVIFGNSLVRGDQLQTALAFARDKGFNKVLQEDNFNLKTVSELDEKGKEVFKYYNITKETDSDIKENYRHKYYSFDELPDDVKEIVAPSLDSMKENERTSFVAKDGSIWYYDKVEKYERELDADPSKPLNRAIEFDHPDGSSILVMPLQSVDGPYIDNEGVLRNYENVTPIKVKLLGKGDDFYKNIVRTLVKDSDFSKDDIDSLFKKNYDIALEKQNPAVFPKDKKDCLVYATTISYADALGESFDKNNVVFTEGQTTATWEQFVFNMYVERVKDLVKNPSKLFLTERAAIDAEYTIQRAKEENIIQEKVLPFEEPINKEFGTALESQVAEEKTISAENKKTLYSFIVKDNAEFGSDFEPVKNLSAKDAVKLFQHLNESDVSENRFGIALEIPGDKIFGEWAEDGISIVTLDEDGKANFGIFGDTFIKQLKEADERSRTYIDAYKELYNAFESERAENSKNYEVVKPSFLYEKEKELFGNVEMENRSIINSENIKLNNITKDENGFNVADLFIPDADYIREASISDERFAMPVVTWKDNDPNINISIVKRLNSEPHNKDIEYMDYSSNGNPSIFENEKWNLVREQKTFDLIGEQIKQYKQEINTEKTETATEVKITPVTFEEILGVMDMRPDYTQSGNFLIFDTQRQEYISGWEGMDEDNGAGVFHDAEEAFERLDIYINDYYIHDMQEQLESVGIEIIGDESLSELCKLYKSELGKGNDKLSIGELNLAMGIVAPDTVIYEQRPSVEKNPENTLQPGQNVSLSLKQLYEELSEKNGIYFMNDKSCVALSDGKTIEFDDGQVDSDYAHYDELTHYDLYSKEGELLCCDGETVSFEGESQSGNLIFKNNDIGFSLSKEEFEIASKTVSLEQRKEEANEIRPEFFLYGDTSYEKISELKEHLSKNGYDVKWQDKSETNSVARFTCDIDDKSYIQTILEDRGIGYEYELGLLATGYDAAWLNEDEQMDAEIVTEEEFKRINELREKEFKDLKLPYIKIDFTEGTTSSHKPAMMESGTVLGLKEGEELLNELNRRFNTFLKCDVSVNFPDAKDNEPGSYSLHYDFHDDKRTLENGKEVSFEREGLSDYIRMTCSYPEVLEKYEEQWQKVNAQNITEEQKKIVADIITPNYEKLKNRYNEQLGNLNTILDVSKELNSSWIVNTSEAKTSKDSIEKEQNAIALSFEKYAGICMNHIADYLDENKNISYKDEFVKYAKHQISNMLQDVKYEESRNAKYGEHDYDFDFSLWSKSLEKVMDASEYDSFLTERLQAEELRYKEIRNAAKDMGLSKEKTETQSFDFELRHEHFIDDEIDKGIESIQVNGGMSEAALEAEYEAQLREQEMELDDEPEEALPVWPINGEAFYESEIEESLKADVEELFRQYDSGETEKNLTLVGVKMYRDPAKDGKISLLVEFDSKNPENRWREDSLFNALNEEGIEFNGMKVEFNPITKEKSGTIEHYLKQLESFGNEEEVIKENAQKLEKKEIEQKHNDISNKISDVVSNEKRILPFSIINNKEKGRVNIKFDTTEINRDILKELKAHGWKFAPSTKQWYPVGNAVNTALDFANKLQEKYTEIKNPKFEKPLDLGLERSPYDGIRFFDRNYNESEEFAKFFNNNLHLFNKGKDPAITEEQASTILKAIGYENVGIVEQRRLRIGLDKNDKIVILSSVNGKVETQKLEFSEVLGFAKEKAAEQVVEAKEILEAYVGKTSTMKKDFQDIFISMYETCIEQAESINKKMQDVYDSFMPKEKEVSKEAILYQRISYRGWEISSDKDFKKSYYVRPFEQTDRSGYILMAGKEGKDGFWQEKFVRKMLKSNNWSEREALIETLTRLASDKETCKSLGIKEPQSLNGFFSSLDKIIHVENDTDIKNELMESLLGSSESYKVSKENIKELSVGDKLGKDSVSDLYKISEGVYQATLSREVNGVGSAQNYFVIDNSIINQLNEELKELVVSFDSKSVIENKNYEPYILKELIEKGLMPPRDDDFIQQLDEYISVHPLKYEKLKPVDYLNFERKLQEIAEVDKAFNKTPFELGQQLIALVDESDRERLNIWLKKQGCDSKEHMAKVFASWINKEQKKDIMQKKDNGYPPRGEN